MVQLAQKLRRELERLEAARPLVWGRRGEGGALAGGAWAGRAESELEALLLEEAEMVFATLSASQRRGFRAVAQRVPFHTGARTSRHRHLPAVISLQTFEDGAAPSIRG